MIPTPLMEQACIIKTAKDVQFADKDYLGCYVDAWGDKWHYWATKDYYELLNKK